MELDLQKIIDQLRDTPGGFISVFAEIQSHYGYVPDEVLPIVAQNFNRMIEEVKDILHSYPGFRQKQIGKHLISVCDGLSCHVRGAMRIIREVERQIQIKPNETTADGEFTFDVHNCHGACAHGPNVKVDDRIWTHAKSDHIKLILEKSRAEIDRVEFKVNQHIFPIAVGCPRCHQYLMDTDYLIDGYPSIKLGMVYQQKSGWVRLSALYTSHTIESEHEVPFDAVVHFFCLHCDAELECGARCYACNSPMALLHVRGEGQIQFCSRRGCPVHLLDLYQICSHEEA